MRRGAALLAALVLGVGACATPKRQDVFAAASTRALPISFRVVARDAEVRSCQGAGASLTGLVETLVRGHPPANAVMNATLHLESGFWSPTCLRLVGTAIEIYEPAGAAPTAASAPGG